MRLVLPLTCLALAGVAAVDAAAQRAPAAPSPPVVRDAPPAVTPTAGDSIVGAAQQAAVGGRMDVAREMFVQARQRAGTPTERLRYGILVSHTYLAEGDDAAALGELAQVARDAEALRLDTVVVRAHGELAVVEALRGRPEAVVTHLGHAETVRQRAGIGSLPFHAPLTALAYALAGPPDSARAVIGRRESEARAVPDSAVRTARLQRVAAERALVLLRGGRCPEALVAVGEAHPDNILAHAVRARCAEQIGRAEEARTSDGQVRSRPQVSPFAWYTIVARRVAAGSAPSVAR